MNLNSYHYDVEWSDDDMCFIATVREMPGIMAHGYTRPEALSSVINAVQLALEVHAADGIPVPVPHRD